MNTKKYLFNNIIFPFNEEQTGMINCRKIATGRDRKQERSEVRLTSTGADPAEMIFAPSQGNILVYIKKNIITK